MGAALRAFEVWGNAIKNAQSVASPKAQRADLIAQSTAGATPHLPNALKTSSANLRAGQ